MRDAGTPELVYKKAYVVNGHKDPALSATAAGILFAHNVISRDQFAAADRYRHAYAISFGLPAHGRCLLSDDRGGGVRSDEGLEHARRRFQAMVALLDPDQKLQIDNLVVSAYIPGWFLAERCGWQVHPRMRSPAPRC